LLSSVFLLSSFLLPPLGGGPRPAVEQDERGGGDAGVVAEERGDGAGDQPAETRAAPPRLCRVAGREESRAGAAQPPEAERADAERRAPGAVQKQVALQHEF